MLCALGRNWVRAASRRTAYSLLEVADRILKRTYGQSGAENRLRQPPAIPSSFRRFAVPRRVGGSQIGGAYVNTLALPAKLCVVRDRDFQHCLCHGRDVLQSFSRSHRACRHLWVSLCGEHESPTDQLAAGDWWIRVADLRCPSGHPGAPG